MNRPKNKHPPAFVGGCFIYSVARTRDPALLPPPITGVIQRSLALVTAVHPGLLRGQRVSSPGRPGLNPRYLVNSPQVTCSGLNRRSSRQFEPRVVMASDDREEARVLEAFKVRQSSRSRIRRIADRFVECLACARVPRSTLMSGRI